MGCVGLICNFHEVYAFLNLIDDDFEWVVWRPGLFHVVVDCFDLVRVEGSVACGEFVEKFERTEVVVEGDAVFYRSKVDGVDCFDDDFARCSDDVEVQLVFFFTGFVLLTSFGDDGTGGALRYNRVEWGASGGSKTVPTMVVHVSAEMTTKRWPWLPPPRVVRMDWHADFK